MGQPEDPPPLRVEISVDTSGLTEAAHKFKAALLFGYHPDLEALDDELDILYRDQM